MHTNHNWSYFDNLLVITEVYKNYRHKDYDLIIKNIANSIGTTTYSVFMKISNMIYILSNGSYGHSNYSEDSRLALFEFLDKNRNVSLNRLLTILK
jgi:hypothetical protein